MHVEALFLQYPVQCIASIKPSGNIPDWKQSPHHLHLHSSSPLSLSRKHFSLISALSSWNLTSYHIHFCVSPQCLTHSQCTIHLIQCDQGTSSVVAYKKDTRVFCSIFINQVIPPAFCLQARERKAELTSSCC